MPILAYCMIDPAYSLRMPGAGVSGACVELKEASGLGCLFSRVGEANLTSGGRARDEALAFHRVLQDIFAQTAILPFRFPTIVAGETELLAHIEEHAADYRNALARLRHMVQMDVRITRDSAAQPKAPLNSSGAEYLRARLGEQHAMQSAAESLRQQTASLIQDWRERSSGSALRCFMLVHRGSMPGLQDALRGFRLAPGLQMRVSGPWPASEFVKTESVKKD